MELLQVNNDRRESRTHNNTYKKLAVQWLNEVLCFVSIPIAIGGGGGQFFALKSPTSCSCKTLYISLKIEKLN